MTTHTHLRTRRTYEPQELRLTLIDFIYRRSRLDIQPEHSLKNIAANAYIRGMNDALEALQDGGSRK